LSSENELEEEEERLDGCRKEGDKVVGVIENCGSAELKAKTFGKSSPSFTNSDVPDCANPPLLDQPQLLRLRKLLTPAMAQSLESRPTVVDFREESPWVQLAKAHWLNTKVRKAKADVIKKQLWDPLEAEAFNSRSLLILENLNVLEKYVLSSHARRS
jgi:hypothetical protein